VRDADDCKGADLSGDKRQARNNRRDAATAEKKIIRVLLLAPKGARNNKQQHNGLAHYDPI
jgi:hypothetical protein